mmetsp:Transcript_29265/g.47244  ORF Transcript_29265/g.47244 Transcript_29265/m.47244 type:complete len:81 (+) Transcript_29265:1349-1591(+)
MVQEPGHLGTIVFDWRTGSFGKKTLEVLGFVVAGVPRGCLLPISAVEVGQLQSISSMALDSLLSDWRIFGVSLDRADAKC